MILGQKKTRQEEIQQDRYLNDESRMDGNG